MPKRTRTQRIWTWSLVGLAVLQVFQPARPVGESSPDRSFYRRMNPPEDVAGLLRQACADCHSQETRWPWYSRVSPVSWFIVGHVEDGRARLDLSRWGDLSAIESRARLDSMARALRDDWMPPASYRALHGGARLDSAQKDRLVRWLETAAAAPISRNSP